MILLGAILTAVAGWAFTFGVPWGNFWIKIACTVAIITTYSLCFRRPRIQVNLPEVLLGIASAAILYGIFWLGNEISPHFVSGASAQVGGIYDLGEGASRLGVFLLLLLVTGPGEEIFWRGFLQESLIERWGPRRAFAAATALYGGVHIFSWNVMLIGAAFTAGIFWGLQHLWRRNLTSLIVSHSLWSAFIFAVIPIR